MKEVPVKIEHEGTWVAAKLGIDKDRFKIFEPFNQEITYKSVIDLEQKKNKLFISVNNSEHTVFKIASVERVLQALKQMILLNCTAYRLNAYFISPAIRGGVLITNPEWEKGAISVLKTGIWFVSNHKQICIPLDEVAGINLTKREIQDKELDVIKIDHLEETEVVGSLVLCPLTTLQILYNFLKETTSQMDLGVDGLDDLSAQIAMLVYSGMDSHAIENMLKLSGKQLDGIYDSLLSKGIAELVCVRKEVQLTAKGVRFISESPKM